MSEYTNFPKDFLVRTKDNLSNYRGSYVVTNLINSCLGLIIIPNELLIKKLPNYQFTDNDKSYGITKHNILVNIENNYSLKKVVRGIRNGLAHGNIEQKTTNKEISGIRISNTYNKKTKLTIEFTVDEFKDFALKLCDDFNQ